MRLTLLTSFLLSFWVQAGAATIPPEPRHPLIQQYDAQDDFQHNIGRSGSKGWAVDFRKDKPGLALASLKTPLFLEPGAYRIVFMLQRGKYPNKGFLYQSYGAVRLELWDLTANELMVSRELQRGDFGEDRLIEPRWMDFTMEGRDGHLLEPRLFWHGLTNVEVERITISRFPDVSLGALEKKAQWLGEIQQNVNIENGFVVVRSTDGRVEEPGDALTYTGYYIASLAWKYAVTKNALTLQAMENSLQALHNAIKGTPDHPLITRFVDEDHNPHPKSPSKDVYMAFFLAHAAAAPHITNRALQQQMQADIERLTNRFLTDNLTVRGPSGTLMSLTPYFTEDEVRKGIDELVANKRLNKKFAKNLRRALKLTPFTELWPGMKKTLRAIEHGDKEKIYSLVIPTLNGIHDLTLRARDILREQYRTDIFSFRPQIRKEYPGKRLEELLTETLKKITPHRKQQNPFERLRDLPVLASNAILTLHIIRSAMRVSNKPQFSEYYRTNLHAQDALLKCALNWYGFEEEITQLTVGNSRADQERRGTLSTLALANLIALETNPSIQQDYITLLNRTAAYYRHEDNPLMLALHMVSQKKKFGETGLLLRALDLYPENRLGYGEAFWKDNGADVGQKWGGGIVDGHSREPLPISHRPKDSFLWQRNARRLKGDHLRYYPTTDFLFVYWYARAHGLIPETPQENTAQNAPPR